MRKHLFILSFLYSGFALNAQSIFQHVYGDSRNERCQSAYQTHDGGILLNGATTSFGSGDVDALIVKTNAQGNILWSQSCGTLANEIPYFATETFDDKNIIIGTTDANSGNMTDALLFKTDSTGNFLWAKSFGGVNNETAVKIIELPDHKYVFTGTTESYGAGSGDIYFAKTDENGDTLLTRVYGTADNERGTSLSATADGGFIICGKSSSMISGSLVFKALLIRIDSVGNLLWTKLYGDTLFQEAQSVEQTTDGGFIVCGSRDFTSSGNYDILLFKTDSAGNLQWSKTYGGNKGEASYTVNLNDDGSFVLSGYTNSMGYGHRFKLANTNYMNEDNRIDYFNQAGNTRGNDSTNIFLMKTDANGDTLWTRTYGDSLQEEAFLSAKTIDGGYILSGFSDYHTSDSSQMLVIKTDSMGFSGCNEYTSHPVIVLDLLTEDSANYNQSAGMNLSTVVLSSTSRNIADLTYCLFTNVNEISKRHSLNLYPNPARESLVIGSFPDLMAGNISVKSTVSVYNMLGEKAFVSFFYNEAVKKFEVNVSALKSGFYLLEVVTENERVVGRFIKE